MGTKLSNFLTIVLVIVSSTKLFSQDINAGEKVFIDRCQTCHSIGDGKIVGPDLKDVAERRDEEWIIKFVQSPMTVIESGDETAQKLYEEYNQIPMPDHKDLTDGDVQNVIAFISDKSVAAAPAPEPEVTATVEAATPVNVSNGPGTLFYAFLGIIVFLLILIAYFFMRVYFVLTASKSDNNS